MKFEVYSASSSKKKLNAIGDKDVGLDDEFKVCPHRFPFGLVGF